MALVVLLLMIPDMCKLFVNVVFDSYVVIEIFYRHCISLQ